MSNPLIDRNETNSSDISWKEDMQAALVEMEQMMLDKCESDIPALTENLKRMISAGGKRLRPSLAWLCYQLGQSDRLPILPLMCIIEMTHTASLIHDDVVDDAPERRGVITIHKMNGKVSAIQCGDYLLAQAVEYRKPYKGTDIGTVLADTSKEMCLGEFQQMMNLYDTKAQTLDTYMEQIAQKTAYLLAASCYCGAVAGGMEAKEAKALREYGLQIGMAFQMKDDILDFADDAQIGKRMGQDLKNGIYTLPFMYAMKHSPDDAMRQMAEKKYKDDTEIKTLVEYVREAGGVDYTRQQIDECSSKAVKALEHLPECEEKQALTHMAKKLAERRS